MAPGERRWTFALEPAGKVVALAEVHCVDDETFTLETDGGFGDLLVARLDRFRIRVRADIAVARVERDGDPEERERRRVASGWPAMGREIVPGETIPAETGIAGVAVSFTKGCYPGQEPIARLHHRGHPNRTLRVLALERGPLPDHDAELTLAGKVVGRVTSSAPDPAHGVVALGYVRREVPPDATLELGGRAVRQL